MEFSARFVREMTIPFCHSQFTSPNISTLTNNLTLDRNNVYNRSLIVDTTGDDIEIPSIASGCRGNIASIIYNNWGYSSITKVKKAILPLYINSIDWKGRTFDGIMKQFFTKVTFNQRLLKVTTPKGEIYYGGLGLVLDEGFSPLLMCGLKARKVITEDNDGKEVVSIQYYRAICRVSPVVFAEPNKLINKGIIKKLIPLYTTIGTEFPSSSLSSPDSRKVEVIIDDFNKFFIAPITPSPSKCSNDTLNKCLNDNIEDILYLI